MGKSLIDLTNQKIGLLTVLRLNPNDYINKNGRKFKQWDCVCRCGNLITVTGDYLKQKTITQSCGCHMHVDSIVGQVFGNLTVISEYKLSNQKIRYICNCACGNSVDVDRYDLIGGKRTSCGCNKQKKRPNRIKDLTGLQFGRLTVVDIDENEYYTKGGKRLYKWVCKCQCGRTVSIEGGKLRKKIIKSCGCAVAEKQGISFEEYQIRYAKLYNNDGATKDLTNKRFGKLVAIRRAQSSEEGRSKWLCACDCGGSVIVQTSNLINGHTQSCGCIDSKGETMISIYLDNHNIKYDKEYTFSECKDQHSLPFDFCIYNEQNKIIGLIEYDGLQHFQVVRFNGMTQERAEASFKIGVEHDKIKNAFCLTHNIPLLRIKYTEINDIDNILDNFITNNLGGVNNE